MDNHPTHLPPSPSREKKGIRKPLLLALCVLLVLVLVWHFIFPVLGVTIAITGTVWGVLVSTVVMLCVAVLLFFLFTGAGILILGVIATVWTIVAIALFPFLFPLFVPLLVIALFIAYLRRRNET